MRRVLVTGASGFVGRVLVEQWRQCPGADRLTLFVLPGESLPEAWLDGSLAVVRGDITDRRAVGAAVAGHSHVIHLAGLISYWRGDLPRLLAVNRDGVANVVSACLEHAVRRLVHVSSVGAVGRSPEGVSADEETPFNWPPTFHYMTSKHAGQRLVEQAVRERGLPAVILNPASIMGPGDADPRTPHNRLYAAIYRGPFFGSFAGGLALVDVRDLARVIRLALERGGVGEKYLIVGANAEYAEVIRLIGKHAGRPVHPFRVPALFFTAAGYMLEALSAVSGRRPFLTAAYGRLSGWRLYNDNRKSVRDFSIAYTDLETTIRDTCRYFEARFRSPAKS